MNIVIVHWKCNLPMTPPVRPLRWSVCHNFLRGREVVGNHSATTAKKLVNTLPL